MSKVFVVTDSTADLSADLTRSLGITVVPLNVHFGDEVYKDGVNITSEEFFAKITTANVMPRTSQPSPGDFEQVYRGLASSAGGQDFVILSIHISSDMSGTYQSAEMARQILEPEGIKITVFDSRLVSTALGVMVKAVAEAARKGQPLDQLVSLAEGFRDNTSIYFTVDTLEFLEKNGRIGKAQALLGGLLKVKPVLQIKGGVVEPFEKLRGAKKVLPRMTQLIIADVPEGKAAYLSIMHTGEMERIEALVEHVRESGKVEDLLLGVIGPVVGCHSGPGALGVSVCVL